MNEKQTDRHKWTDMDDRVEDQQNRTEKQERQTDRKNGQKQTIDNTQTNRQTTDRDG